MNPARVIPTSDPHLDGVIPTRGSAMIPTPDPHSPARPPIGGAGEVGIGGSEGMIPTSAVGIGDHQCWAGVLFKRQYQAREALRFSTHRRVLPGRWSKVTPKGTVAIPD